MLCSSRLINHASGMQEDRPPAALPGVHYNVARYVCCCRTLRTRSFPRLTAAFVAIATRLQGTMSAASPLIDAAEFLHGTPTRFKAHTHERARATHAYDACCVPGCWQAGVRIPAASLTKRSLQLWKRQRVCRFDPTRNGIRPAGSKSAAVTRIATETALKFVAIAAVYLTM